MATESELDNRSREISDELADVERVRAQIEGSKKWYHRKDYQHWDSLLRCANRTGELQEERRNVNWRLHSLRTTGSDPGS